MFEVEKPRRFHYEPRFYDPEKERWEALKKKYAMEQEKREAMENPTDNGGGEVDLAYFERRVRELDRESRKASSKLGWKDLFRKREMPKFNYQPRFSASGDDSGKGVVNDEEILVKYRTPKHRIKIKRRFDISDTDYMKPIPGTKIIVYTGIVCLLLAIIFLF